MPEKEAIRIARMDHRYLVDLDIRAGRVPAGMQVSANGPNMDKYPGVDCAGDIQVGYPLKKQPRLNKKEIPVFDFEEAS